MTESEIDGAPATHQATRRSSLGVASFTLASALLVAACASRVVPDASGFDASAFDGGVVGADRVDVTCPPEAPVRCLGICVADTNTNPGRCGSGCTPCRDPGHGVAACVEGVCAPQCAGGFVAQGDVCIDAPAPRPVHPLANSRLSVRNPTLRWALPVGIQTARVTVCRDRACDVVASQFDVTGSMATVPTELAESVWFWNLRAVSGGVVSAAVSPTWHFHTPASSAPVEWARANRPDFNGDGKSVV